LGTVTFVAVVSEKEILDVLSAIKIKLRRIQREGCKKKEETLQTLHISECHYLKMIGSKKLGEMLLET
jgi:hypothetical protein